MPWLITLMDVCKRTGWTLEELEGQDMSRVIPGLIGQNIRDELQRVEDYVSSQGKTGILDSDLGTYGRIQKMIKHG